MNRYTRLRISVLLTCIALAGYTAEVVASSAFTTQTTGHVRIIAGKNAGLSVTPSFLEFGNVTYGTFASQNVILVNTGSCTEIVYVNATAPGLATIRWVVMPPLPPGSTSAITLTLNATATPLGDYPLTFTWVANCQ